MRSAGGSYQTIEDMEKHMIEKALTQHNRKHSAVASQLGLSRQTLYNKIKKYGL
jgi:transcriptional regulator with PAS, ATPase and Fis domain